MSPERSFVSSVLAVATVSLAVCVSAATTATPNPAFHETDPIGDPTRAGTADITAIDAESLSWPPCPAS